MTGYAELQVTTNYSFLRGGSHPDELVLTAKALGLAAIGVTDRNTLAGVVRAHVAAKGVGLRLLVTAHNRQIDHGKDLPPRSVSTGPPCPPPPSPSASSPGC